MLRQRVYGLALGYEDQNDHQDLRHDVGLQTAVGCDDVLAGQSTLNRFENRAERGWAWAIHEVLVETFIESHRKPPRELVLDIDATDDPVHGNQVGKFFHGFYDEYCFLPLYVVCGSQVLAAYLRPSNQDQAKHSRAIVKLLVERLRQAWPNVKIIVRADSGFCRPRLLSWLERHDVGYVLGVARNPRLEKKARPLMRQAMRQWAKEQRKQRVLGEIRYAAETWNRRRRVLVRAEYSDRGENPRFVVTNLEGSPDELYDGLYCARGDMENRIKEQQLHLFADRTSAHQWWPNQLRLLLSSLAYTLIDHIRRTALQGTELAKAYCERIRLRLFKIGAVIVRNSRRVVFMLSSACPSQDLFRLAAARLGAT
jgi:hypothetical protein